MPKGTRHLTYEQRCQIEALLQSGKSQAEIARQLGVTPSTISRELDRNAKKAVYDGPKAHNKAVTRRKKASSVPRKITNSLIERIENLLTGEQWSPDQISGFLRRREKLSVSHEWIYQHIWRDKKNGGDLWTHLRPFRCPIACAI